MHESLRPVVIGLWFMLSAGQVWAGGLNVLSSAFADGTRIPERFAHGPFAANLSPPLSWGGAPPGTMSFAVLVEDVDTARPFAHWVLYDIPATVTSLAEATAGVGIPGKSDFGHAGWGGPMPPEGRGAHRYAFRVMALDTLLQAGGGLTRDQLLERVRGHILAEGALVGTFERRAGG